MQSSHSTSLFKACADETRLRILLLLKGSRELCVCDIMDVIGHAQPKISRHLAYLRRSGLVGTRRQGTWIYYFLHAPRGAFHKKLIDCLDHCFQGVKPVLTDRKKLKKVIARRAC